MKRFKDIKLGIKVIAAFLFVGLTPLIVSGILSLKLSDQALSETALNPLDAIREIEPAHLMLVEKYFSF